MTSSQGSYVDALRHRDFQLLTIAQTQSKMGDWDVMVPAGRRIVVQDEPADALYVLAGGPRSPCGRPTAPRSGCG